MQDTFIVDRPGKGRCVIASKDFDEGDIIEICETLIIDKKYIKILKYTPINQYWFGIGDDEEPDACMLLGNGSLYNHSSKEPNLKAYDAIIDNRLKIFFSAIKPIKKGDELCFDYGYSVENELSPIKFA